MPYSPLKAVKKLKHPDKNIILAKFKKYARKNSPSKTSQMTLKIDRLIQKASKSRSRSIKKYSGNDFRESLSQSGCRYLNISTAVVTAAKTQSKSKGKHPSQIDLKEIKSRLNSCQKMRKWKGSSNHGSQTDLKKMLNSTSQQPINKVKNSIHVGRLNKLATGLLQNEAGLKQRKQHIQQAKQLIQGLKQRRAKRTDRQRTSWDALTTSSKNFGGGFGGKRLGSRLGVASNGSIGLRNFKRNRGYSPDELSSKQSKVTSGNLSISLFSTLLKD